ncbi:RNA-binding protein [Schizosaccharomyces cryophilus OY26]|uniref:RNA-binding protein n=1 Tax=Schizosaccharomyces cryophilus (strain OY26 / ATCC MYA-4695 / CBS 11777 / NBRC 106824 / NRRL Y48691) TaxID=653667 RepID=S9W1P7_SCHCR|nr:RNA-binding protein [Schizosaccharomyces cryophilus OY26]EPY51940.1 RNA-binding protein [Schizosaccharomyces cryophilus OY26]
MIQEQTLAQEKDQKVVQAAPVNESEKQPSDVYSKMNDTDFSNNRKDSAGDIASATASSLASGSTTPVANDQSSTHSSVNVWAVRREQLSQKASGSQDEQKQSKNARLEDPNIWPSPELVEQKSSEEKKHDPEVKKPLAPKTNGKEKWIVITPEISHPPIHPSKKPNRSRNDGNRRSGSARRKGSSQNYSQNQNRRQENVPRNTAQSFNEGVASTGTTKSSEQPSAANNHFRPNPRRIDDTLQERGINEASQNNSGFRGRNYRKGYRSKNPNHRSNRSYHHPKVQNVPVVTNPAGTVQYVYDVKAFLTSQIDYYMSIENLCKDMFLRKHMDDEGYVSLAFLASFNRIKSLTSDINLLLSACEASSVVTLNPHFESPIMAKIRRSETWEPWVLPKEQRLFELPNSTASQQNSNNSSLVSSISNLSIAPSAVEMNNLSGNIKDNLMLSEPNA